MQELSKCVFKWYNFNKLSSEHHRVPPRLTTLDAFLYRFLQEEAYRSIQMDFFSIEKLGFNRENVPTAKALSSYV